METSEIRERAEQERDQHLRVYGEGHDARQNALIYALAVEVERLQEQRADLENRLAAVERRVGALEEPMP